MNWKVHTSFCLQDIRYYILGEIGYKWEVFLKNNSTEVLFTQVNLVDVLNFA